MLISCTFRPLLISLSAILLAAFACACGSAHAQATAASELPFAEFIAGVRAEALGKGVAAGSLDAALTGLVADPKVLELINRQPEHDRTAGAYVTHLLSADRIAAGRAKLAEHAAIFASIEARFGVDRRVLTAIWGIETNYGTTMGDRPIVQSLATLAHGDSRRPLFWRAELLAVLRILQQGDASPGRLTGSWAGAMGHMQFMPTTFLRHAVDFDQDGRRDMWGSIGDAMGSAASYLHASGWSRDLPWGFPVLLPTGFDYGLSAPGQGKRAPAWQALGVAIVPGQSWPATAGELALLLPAGASGPAFLVTANFRAILRYNASTAYALAVGLLADALATQDPPPIAWPDGDRALTRAEREDLQRLLTSLGFDTGGIDGLIGNQTRTAIRAWQRAKTLPEDGHPSADVLERLRMPRN